MLVLKLLTKHEYLTKSCLKSIPSTTPRVKWKIGINVLCISTWVGSSARRIPRWDRVYWISNSLLQVAFPLSAEFFSADSRNYIAFSVDSRHWPGVWLRRMFYGFCNIEPLSPHHDRGAWGETRGSDGNSPLVWRSFRRSDYAHCQRRVVRTQ